MERHLIDGIVILLDEFDEYLDIIEGRLRNVKTDFEARFENSRLSTEEKTDLIQYYFADFYKHEEVFPALLRHSFFISCWSLFEHHLDLTCGLLKEKMSLPISWNELRLVVLDRAKRYFQLAGFPILYDDQTLWKELRYHYKIRNCIVHNNGALGKLQNDINFIHYAEQNGLVHGEAPDIYILLTEEFCRKFMRTIETFFNSISKTYEELINQQEQQI